MWSRIGIHKKKLHINRDNVFQKISPLLIPHTRSRTTITRFTTTMSASDSSVPTPSIPSEFGFARLLKEMKQKEEEEVKEQQQPQQEPNATDEKGAQKEESVVVLPRLSSRYFSRHSSFPLENKTNQLGVLSYNILADKYVRNRMDKLYSYCPNEYLLWENRCARLKAEISAYDADILCLQECDLVTFDAEFGEHLRTLGYEYVLQNDTKRKKGHDIGNVTIFRSSKFEVVWENSRSRALLVALRFKDAVVENKTETETGTGTEGETNMEKKLEHASGVDESIEDSISACIKTNAGTDSHNDRVTATTTTTTATTSKTDRRRKCGNEQDEEKEEAKVSAQLTKKERQHQRRLERKNKNKQANKQANKLKQKHSKEKSVNKHNAALEGECIYIANVHLEGDPYATQKRFNQLKSVLKNLRARQLQSRKSPSDCASVICGDFNASAKSGVYKVLQDGYLSALFREPLAHLEMVATTQDYKYDHAFASVYTQVMGQEPLMTFSVRNFFQSTLDFMFVSPAVTPLKVMEVISDGNVQHVAEGYIPSSRYPSDHLAIGSIMQVNLPGLTEAASAQAPAPAGTADTGVRPALHARVHAPSAGSIAR